MKLNTCPVVSVLFEEEAASGSDPLAEQQAGLYDSRLVTSPWEWFELMPRREETLAVFSKTTDFNESQGFAALEYWTVGNRIG